jgi:hypothetical protein
MASNISRSVWGTALTFPALVPEIQNTSGAAAIWVFPRRSDLGFSAPQGNRRVTSEPFGDGRDQSPKTFLLFAALEVRGVLGVALAFKLRVQRIRAERAAAAGEGTPGGRETVWRDSLFDPAHHRAQRVK